MNLLRNIMYRVLEQANGEGAGATGSVSGSSSSGSGNNQADNTADANQRAEVEARAREWGWAPKDQWRGNPEGWLDAPEFVRRGEQVLPILQANYRKTETEVRQLRQQNQQIQQQLAAANESIGVLTNLSTEASRQSAKEKRRELLRAQAQARTDGDVEAEIDLGGQIADITVEINRGEAEATNTKGKKPASANANSNDNDNSANDDGSQGNDPTKDPAYQSFVQSNSWFGQDRRRTALAVAIGQELRSNPANDHLQGKAFFDRIVEEVNRTIAPPRANGSKVEGGNSGSANNGAQNFSDPASGKSFNDLPADAKAAFERQAKMVVGEGRAFKTKDEWRKYYITSYFNQ